jgi:hypothetical protein
MEKHIRYLYNLFFPNEKLNTDDMINELALLKMFFKQQTTFLNLKGDIAELHYAILPEEHTKYGSMLKSYIDIFGIKIEENVVDSIIFAKIKFNEVLVKHKELEREFLSDRHSKSINTSFSGKLENYYFQIGELTYQGLMQKYSKFELMNICAMLYHKIEDNYSIGVTEYVYIPRTSHTNKDISLMILHGIDIINPDPRSVLGLYDIYIILNDEDGSYNINNLQIDEEHLYSQAMKEGIDIIYNDYTKDLSTVYDDYIVSQMTPTFFTDIEIHRYIDESCTPNIIDEKLISEYEYGEIVFYGIRYSGKYACFTIDQLIKTFSEEEEFFMPSSNMLFPIQTMKRLVLTTLPRLSHTNNKLNVLKLIKIIREMYSENMRCQESLDNLKENLNTIDKDILIKDLKNMMNIGILLSNWDKEFAIPNSSIEPMWDRDLRLKVLDVLIKISNISDSTKELNLIRLYDNEYHICLNKFGNIGDRIEFMNEANKLNLHIFLQKTGNHLVVTANFYHMMISGYPITKAKLDFADC